MAHQIEQNMLAYQGAKPWHGLGVHVPANATGEEMMKLAGLDWTVEAKPIFVGEYQSTDNDNQTYTSFPVEDYRAICRINDEFNVVKTFTVASGRYEIVQNAEIIDLFREYVEAGDCTMETVGGLNGGAVVWALARLKGADTNLKGVDKLESYMIMSTSHDGSLATTAKPTQVRVVCHNTLTAALSEPGKKGQTSFKMRHSTAWSTAKAEEAKRTIEQAVEAANGFNLASAKLADCSIQHSDWLEFMGRLMGDVPLYDVKGQMIPMVDQIAQATQYSPGADLVTAKGTLWGAVNGVTYFCDHQRGRTQDSRLMNAWFGVGDKFKNKAMDVAMEMVTAGS